MTQPTLPAVQVAMITYNGARFLPEQLESILKQTHRPSAVWVSDDGSTDGTLQILSAFQDAAPFPVNIVQGPKSGAAVNMLSLFSHLPISPTATCDQDDIWLPDKLRHAAEALAKVDDHAPCIHVSRRDARHRSLQKHAHSFPNALVENRAPGNAATFNASAVEALTALCRHKHAAPAFFDWMAYQVVLVVGGSIIDDPRQGLFYRAHRRNLLGPKRSLVGCWRRVRSVALGDFNRWVWQQAAFLVQCRPFMEPCHAAHLDDFLSSAASRKLSKQSKRRSSLETILLRAFFSLPLNQKFTSDVPIWAQAHSEDFGAVTVKKPVHAMDRE